MKILSITAGAAGMYCGSCARDNALAAELLARGHDVTLVPVYTPTRTDEPNMSRKRVLFGGISVYLQQHAALFRMTPRFLDRLWDSPRVIDAFAGKAVSNDPQLLGDLTISMLRGEQGALRKEFAKMLDWLRREPPPDVVNLPNSLLIALAAPLRKALNRPVCCTLQGEELFINGLAEPYRARAIEMIRQQVPQVDRFIAVSAYCARFMAEFLAIPNDRIAVVPLGINMSGYDRRRRSNENAGEFRIGYFARIGPEKGLRVLADAYVRFRQKTGQAPVRLEAAGYLAPAFQAYMDDVRGTLEKAGLAGEFSYRGVVDRAGKLAFLQSLDVLSVPATYDEPKGMFLLEAMANGVPVVQPRRGAFVEIVAKTGGGLLVEPDDPEKLADGLYTLWRDRNAAETLGQRAFQGVRAHYTVARSADRLLGVYDNVLQPQAKSLEVSNLSKHYATPRGKLSILSEVSLLLAPGDAAAIVGPSGSGKSSLLYILGGLEPPSAGTVSLGGRDLYTLAPSELAGFRNSEVGFVFQDHCLLPQCSVLENVLVPTLVDRAGDSNHRAELSARARALIEQVGLGDRIEHRPGELSGGEKQRVAIARALIQHPHLVLCDEPTGNLDPVSAAAVASLLLDLHRRQKNILIVVTHSAKLASQFPIRFELVDNKLKRPN